MAGVPKLIVLSEKLRGKNFELTKDIHTVGRTEDRDICIKDATISTHHCDFIKSGDSYILRDNDSTNGSRVNNVPITEQLLQNSDILQLGSVEILFDCDDKSVTTITRTQTGIDLKSGEEIAPVSGLQNLSTFANKKSKYNAHKILIFGSIFLAIVIVLLLIWVLFNMYIVQKQHPESEANVSVEQSAKPQPTGSQSAENKSSGQASTTAKANPKKEN